MSRKIGETSYKQTAFGIIPRSRLIPLEIEGIKRAWDFILQSRERGLIVLDRENILKIHKIGFGWIFPEDGGKFRKIDVTVSQHVPPKFYHVAQLMDNFLKDLEVRLDNLPDIGQSRYLDELIELLAWAHHRFLWIHPFCDYNGRIGRLLINIILLNLNLPPIELKVETQKGRLKYVKALEQADHGDYKNLKKLIAEALEESIRALPQ